MLNARNKAFNDYKNGMRMSDIAAKYDVSFNTVKSWARRHWKLKEGHSTSNRVKPRPHGTPKGSQNNLIHGEYSKIAGGVSDDTECEFVDFTQCVPEQIVKDVIIFYTLREQRLFKLMSAFKPFTALEMITSTTHITRRKNGGRTIIRIHAPIYIYLAINKELTKISIAKCKAAILLSKLSKAKKSSSGALRKIYSMAETAKKSEIQLTKIVDKCMQYIPNAA